MANGARGSSSFTARSRRSPGSTRRLSSIIRQADRSPRRRNSIRQQQGKQHATRQYDEPGPDDGSRRGQRGARAIHQRISHQGAACLARHGSAGARRRLRPAGLCAQSRPGRQAPHRQQRQGPRRDRRAGAGFVRADRHRESRHLPHARGQRAHQHLHSWRRLARQPRRRLCVPGGALRQCRRALRHPRLHQCRRSRRQPVPDGRAGAARGGVGLSQCQDASAAIRTASI